jgi:hypothetical protein
MIDEQSLEGSLEKLETSLTSILNEQDYIKQKELITRRSLLCISCYFF